MWDLSWLTLWWLLLNGRQGQAHTIKYAEVDTTGRDSIWIALFASKLSFSGSCSPHSSSPAVICYQFTSSDDDKEEKNRAVIAVNTMTQCWQLWRIQGHITVIIKGKEQNTMYIYIACTFNLKHCIANDSKLNLILTIFHNTILRLMRKLI